MKLKDPDCDTTIFKASIATIWFALTLSHHHNKPRIHDVCDNGLRLRHVVSIVTCHVVSGGFTGVCWCTATWF